MSYSTNLICVLPVTRFGNTTSICSSEFALVVQSSNGSHKLSHWVQVVREVVQHTGNMSRKISARVPFLADGRGLKMRLFRVHNDYHETKMPLGDTCLLVGMSPVQRSHHIPSGMGSSPPGAFGSIFWHSGIEYPRNLIPSSGSSTEVSVTIPFIERIPP